MRAWFTTNLVGFFWVLWHWSLPWGARHRISTTLLAAQAGAPICQALAASPLSAVQVELLKALVELYRVRVETPAVPRGEQLRLQRVARLLRVVAPAEVTRPDRVLRTLEQAEVW